jgi:hypothetical protein
MMRRNKRQSLAAAAIDVHSKSEVLHEMHREELQGLPELITVQMTIHGRCWPAAGGGLFSPKLVRAHPSGKLDAEADCLSFLLKSYKVG